MNSIFHYNLVKDISLMLNDLNDADDYNVIIQVGEGNNIKEFRANSNILRARCPYFKQALTFNWIIRKNNIIVFNKPNITSTVFDMILKYIYTGELDLTEQSGEDIFDLLIASDELLLEELFKYAQDYLIKEKTSWIHQNFDLIIHVAFKINSCKKLQYYCFETICEDPQLSLTSKMFSLIDQESLSNILKKDNLQVKEINIWNYLIKWGIKQTPGLGSENSDRTKWNDKNYKELKKILDPFIPLIRFVSICRTDFFNQVRPYRAIIPNDIYEEIDEYYYINTLPKTKILPTRAGRIDSNIIKEELINIFANWIDNKNAMDIRTGNDIFYKFSLIYRGSHDGISNISFINKCNHRVATLVLIKVLQSNEIFGGYAFFGLLGEDISNNFVFSFKEGQTMKIGRAKKERISWREKETYGFRFCESMYMDDRTL
ncbi:hypothetical protein RhiirC2_782958 [Rhizophagus irregularis]|uniref:BTB domain-containing protein n=1 Tax=Rhizophagus irregularis TaxID=588596 RepID=A0A2N1N1P6_9GLOM|nr:hypothetical protein RhiirC2_782958 [Rhizophagus irregularis]